MTSATGASGFAAMSRAAQPATWQDAGNLRLGELFVSEDAGQRLRGGVGCRLDLANHLVALQTLLDARPEWLGEDRFEQPFKEVHHLVVDWAGYDRSPRRVLGTQSPEAIRTARMRACHERSSASRPSRGRGVVGRLLPDGCRRQPLDLRGKRGIIVGAAALGAC